MVGVCSRLRAVVSGGFRVKTLLYEGLGFRDEGLEGVGVGEERRPGLPGEERFE